MSAVLSETSLPTFSVATPSSSLHLIIPESSENLLTVFDASDILNDARKTGCLFIPENSTALVSEIADHGWGDYRQFVGFGVSEQEIVRLMIEGNKLSPLMRPNLVRYPASEGDCIDLATAVLEPWNDVGFKRLGIDGGVVASSIFRGILRRWWIPVDLGNLRQDGAKEGLTSETFCNGLNLVVEQLIKGNGPVTVQEMAARSLEGPVRWFADTCVRDC